MNILHYLLPIKKNNSFNHYSFKTNHRSNTMTNQQTSATVPPIDSSIHLNSFEKFFLWLSGTDMDIIKKCTRQEKIRQTNIGILLLFLFMFSSFSAYVAITEIKIFSDSFILRMLLAVIFGACVTSLDRYILSLNSNPHEKIWNKFFNITFFVRILLSVVIGLVISTPLELKIFQDEINNYYLNQKKEKITSINKQYYIDKNTEQAISILKNNIQETKNEIKKTEETLAYLRNELKKGCYYKSEQDNTWYLTLKGKNIKNQIEFNENKLKTYYTQLQKQQNEYDQLQNKYFHIMDQSKQNLVHLENQKEFHLGNKLKIYSIITSYGSGLFWAKWFITLFFVLTDCIPIIIKTFFSNNLYEKLLYNKNMLIQSNDDYYLQQHQLTLNKNLMQANYEQKIFESALDKDQKIHQKQNEVKSFIETILLEFEKLRMENELKNLIHQKELEELQKKYEKEKQNLHYDLEINLQKNENNHKLNQQQINQKNEIEELNRNYFIRNYENINQEKEYRQRIEKAELMHQQLLDMEKLLHELKKDEHEIIFKEKIQSMIDIINRLEKTYLKYFNQSESISFYKD